MKKFLVIAAILIAAAALVWMARSEPSANQTNTEKLKIAASFYPVAHFAEKIGGDRVEVTNITPAGAEPHDFEPTPRDLIDLEQSMIFIYNGAGFEPWVDKVLSELAGKGVILVDSSVGIDLLEGSEHEENEEEGEDHEEEEEHSGNDPHFWLDPILASQQVGNIKQALIQADPENQDFYEARASAYLAELQQLDREVSQKLSSCERRDIVVSHDAFNYLGKRYTINMTALSGISPDEEPSPQRMAEITDFAREHGIKYIFFETLVSDDLSQTIASEIGAQTLVLNPLEGLTSAEIEQGKDYLSIQRDNMRNLKLAMNCQ